MSVKTTNSYGNITISNRAIAVACGNIARDVYGVIDLVGRKLSDNFTDLLNKQKSLSRGVKVLTVNNRIYIDLFVVIKYGISINAVSESLKKAVKYGLEEFTGMIVDSVNITIIGVRV